MGHIGLLPQSSNVYKLKGKNSFQKKQILQDAMTLSNSGVFAIVIECVVESLAKKITNAVTVPTIGIGASAECDGQVLVTEDLLGLFNDFTPSCVKRYGDLGPLVEKAAEAYGKDVRARRFPAPEHCFKANNNNS